MKKIKSLESIVGKETYKIWTDMLSELVPDGRTQRLSVVVAGMVMFAASKLRSSDSDLLDKWDFYDEDVLSKEVMPLIEKLFEDANVGFERTNYHGENYSIAEEAMYQCMCWYNMPWE